jgi:hypothetical protein
MKKPSPHPDEREDKALIRKMVKSADLKKGAKPLPPKPKGK